MNHEPLPAQGPLDREVRGVWRVYALHAFIIVASMLGAIIAWGWFGPFAGLLWSGVCFTFGVLFGMTLEKRTPNDGGQRRDD